MFADVAFDLVKDLKCSSHQVIPPFNDDGVRQVLEEIKAIFDENCVQAARYSSSGDRTLWPLLNFRHAALHRNKRCILVYLNERLLRIKALRWEFGPIIPNDIKNNLCDPEITFYKNYSKLLSNYVRSIGNGHSLDITTDLRPPKSLFIEVRCMEDFGDFELDDNQVIHLKKHSLHYLPRSQVEPLIRRGILQHIM